MALDPKTLNRLATLTMRSRKKFLSIRQGGHTSLKRGHGIEFSDYRKYELGDDPRHIDWKVYARNDRLYVKQFQEEQNLSVFVLVDGSASMFIPKIDKKFERAKEIALALSYIALIQQDRVAVSVPGITKSAFVEGPKGIHKITKILDAANQKEFDFEKATQNAIRKISFPGVAIIVSDFLLPFENIKKLFDTLRAKNLDITAIQVLGEHDINPFKNEKNFKAKDSETGKTVNLNYSKKALSEYTESFSSHTKHLDEYFKSANIHFKQYMPENSLFNFLGTEIKDTGLVQ